VLDVVSSVAIDARFYVLKKKNTPFTGICEKKKISGLSGEKKDREARPIFYKRIRQKKNLCNYLELASMYSAIILLQS
jgi:hypothetical protein